MNRVWSVVIAGLMTLPAWGDDSLHDWKVYSMSEGRDGLVYFFDDKTILTTALGVTKVWIKTLHVADVVKASNSKSIIESANHKAGSIYIPPIIPLLKLDADTAFTVIKFEQVADAAQLQPYAMGLMEMNCREREARLTGTNVWAEGKSSPRKIGDGLWEPIAPESSLESLQLMVCKS